MTAGERASTSTSTSTNVSPSATARANANIALVKYWGKRDERLRLPMNGSISFTLDGLAATTTVTFDRSLERDVLGLDGSERRGKELARVSAFLDLVRARAGGHREAVRARVVSRSEVPVGAGLASSAAGFAALALAASAAAGLELERRELSVLARLGSGSACRSVFGGFVEWRRGGDSEHGSDSFAEQLARPHEWPLRMAIALVSAEPKAEGSTEGMARTVEAAGYRHWLATVEADLRAVRRGVTARDLDLVGRTAEASCVKMHLAAASASPPIVYWREATERVVSLVPRLRDEGLEAYYTVDAGPNVAVLVPSVDCDALCERLREVDGVARVLSFGAGGDAALVP